MKNSLLMSPSVTARAGTKVRSHACRRTSFCSDNAGPSFHTASADEVTGTIFCTGEFRKQAQSLSGTLGLDFGLCTEV